MKPPTTITTVHLRLGEEILVASGTEVGTSHVELLEVRHHPRGTTIDTTPIIQLFFHRPVRGQVTDAELDATEVALAESMDTLIDAAVRIRHRALARIGARGAEKRSGVEAGETV